MQFDKFRRKHNLSEEAFSLLTGIPLATLIEWRANRSFPSVAQLIHIAAVFKVAPEKLISPPDLSLLSRTIPDIGKAMQPEGLNEVERLQHWYAGRSVLWGYLGLTLHGEPRPRWFPVTAGQAAYFDAAISFAHTETMVIGTTCNDRQLVFSPARLAATQLVRVGELVDGAPPQLGWDGDGLSKDVYRALIDMATSDFHNIDPDAPEYDRHLDVIYNCWGACRCDRMMSLVCNTIVHSLDGTKFEIHAHIDDLEEALKSIPEGSRSIYLGEVDGEREAWISLDVTSLIEMPLLGVEMVE
jgi:transcriptional regulator with XRE-family HTH domain